MPDGTFSPVVDPLLEQPSVSPYDADETTPALADVAQDETSDETTDSPLDDLSPEELRALLAKERADKEALRKRKDAGRDGALKQERLAREQAEADMAQLRAEVSELKQTQNQQAQRAVQAQLSSAIDTQLDEFKRGLEAKGWDDDTINERVHEKRQTLQSQARAEAAEWKAARSEWRTARDTNLDNTLAAVATDFKEEWGIDLALDRNAVLKDLKLDIMAAYPGREPGGRAADEYQQVLTGYLKAQRKAAIAAFKGQAAKTVTQPTRREAAADSMAEGGGGGVDWNEAQAQYLADPSDANLSRFETALRTAPSEVRRRYAL